MEIIYTYLNISGFFDCLNKLELQQNVVTPKMHPGHGTNDNIDKLDSTNKALEIRKGALHKVSPLLLEGQEHLQLLNIKTNLWPLKDIGWVT